MSWMNLVFIAFALAHGVLMYWGLKVCRSNRTIGAVLMVFILPGLIYDNLIIAVGHQMGEGTLLYQWNVPRFILHAALSPLLFVLVLEFVARSGGKPRSRKIVWGALAVGSGFAIYRGIAHANPDLVLVEAYGTLRYTARQTDFSEIVPLMLALVGFLGVGALILWRQRSPWLLLATLSVFLLNSPVPSSLRFATSNLAEVIWMAALILTERGLPAGLPPFGETR